MALGQTREGWYLRLVQVADPEPGSVLVITSYNVGYVSVGMNEQRSVVRAGPVGRAPAFGIAGAAMLVVLWRMGSSVAFERFDTTALVLFGIASAALLAPHALSRLRKVKYGDVEFDFAELEQLPAVPAGDGANKPLPSGVTTGAPADWTRLREEVKARSRDVFLAHVIRPSKERSQKYDIFILLSRMRSAGLGDVKTAEFFFGRHWGNRVFRVERTSDTVGVSTSAYGPFLAICRVTFEDGYTAFLERFIDFEMGRIFDEFHVRDEVRE